MRDRGAKLLFLTPHRGHRIPARPETLSMKVSLSSTTLPCNGDGALALDLPNHCSYRILRRHADQHMDLVLDHMPCHDGAPPLPANSRHTGPKNCRILPYNAFFRPCGINTPWYVPAAPVKFEAESATSGTHKWVAPDGP